MKIAKTVYTIICDDIRQEVDNKMSYIGIYDEDVVVDKIPTLIPILSFVITLKETKIKENNFKIVIDAPKVEPYIVEFSPADSAYTKDGDVRLLFRLSPFWVKAEGKVKIKLKFKDSDKEYTIDTFKIISGGVID